MLLLVIDIGDWVKFPETVHELYAHLPQMIGRLFIRFIFIFMCYFLEKNEGRGLKRLSEENLEVLDCFNAKPWQFYSLYSDQN